MPDPTPEQETVTFLLDGREVRAAKGELVIAAAERAGTFIPRFCYHPRMTSVGMCRMCLVEVDSPRGPTLQPACYVSVADQMKVVTDSPAVKKAQDGVLEFLLVNHPLDCPVCDKGGECPLQDQTLAHGPGDTRFLEEKRHFEKPIALSDLVLLDRERCIQCARCTRFAAEVAGEAQIDFAGRGEQVEVAAFPTQRFTSHYSGNTVQICPVGALTAAPYRFSARPWDLEQVESTCTTCAVGCRMAVQSSQNRVTRLLGVDSEPVNHGWLCDKGRFAYESTNGPEPDEAPSLYSPRRRLTAPLVRKGEELVEASWGEAIEAAADAIRRATSTSPEGVGAIGGAALTNEGQYAWVRLLKGVVGTDNVDAQLGDGLDPLLLGALPRATIAETANARCVLLVTGDLDQELPVLYLRLRAAALQGTTLVEVAEAPTRLTALCTASLRARPGELHLAIAAIAGDDASASRLLPHAGAAATATQLAAARDALRGDGEGTVVVLGRPNLAEDPRVIEAAARRLLEALPRATFLVALRRGNVSGAVDLGLVPGLLPGRVRLESGRAFFAGRWGNAPKRTGRDALGQLRALASREQRALVVLGADPLSDVLDTSLARTALEVADDVVVVGGHGGELLRHASVVLPTSVAHERPGTTTNLEGRVTRLGQLLMPPGMAWHDTDIASELAAALGAGDLVADTEAITDEIAEVSELHKDATAAALAGAPDGAVLGRGVTTPPRLALDPIAFPGVQPVEFSGFRTPAGALAEPSPPSALAAGVPRRIERRDALEGSDPELPAPDAYALRLVVTRRLYDRGAALEASPSLLGLVETATVRANPYDLDRIGAADGRDVRLRAERGTVVVRCIGDPDVARGTLCVGFNLDVPGQDRVAAVLAAPDHPVSEVRMESL